MRRTDSFFTTTVNRRVFVERGGIVYFGDQNVAGITRNTLHLNLAAANAVFAALGIAAIAP